MKVHFRSRSVLAVTLLSVVTLVGCSKPAAPTPGVGSEGSAQRGATGNQQKQDSRSPEQIVDEAIQVALKTVYFDFDSATLTDEGMANLREMARGLRADAKIKVKIVGHTDERGSNEYNLALGQRRADTIKDFLTAEGATADQLVVTSAGEEIPAIEGQSEDAWSKNRRGEFERIQ